MNASRKLSLFDLDCYGVVGKKRSGKSLLMVMWIVKWIVKDRRPVYTNLPLRFRVLRRYLTVKYDGRFCALVQPLSRDHLMRFIDRQHREAEYLEVCRVRAGREHNPPWDEVEGEFVELHGPRVNTGDGANWIPAGAIILVDEAHEWFPGHRDRTSADTTGVVRYMAKLGHHSHTFVWASQDEIRVSKALRETSDWIIEVINGAQRLGWLGPIARDFSMYRRYSFNAWDKKDQPGAEKPGKKKVLLRTLPCVSVYFRFYESFTHAGSASRLLERVGESRTAAGLSPDGLTEREAKRIADRPVPKPIRGRQEVRYMRKWARRGWRDSKYAAVLYMGAALGAQVVGSQSGTVEVADDESDNAVFAPADPMRGVGSDFVRVGSRRVSLGDDYGGFVLSYVSAADRLAVFVGSDAVWMWKHGDGPPRNVGPVADVLASLEARRPSVDQGDTAVPVAVGVADDGV